MLKPNDVLRTRKVPWVLGLLIPSALAGCGSGGLGSTPTVSGTINGWTMGTGYTAQAVADMPTSPFASGPIAADGSFSLTLAVPGGLKPFGLPSLCQHANCTLQASPTQVMGTSVEFEIPTVVSLQPQKRASGSVMIAYYFYVDNDITVTGQQPRGTTAFYTYDLHFKTGWNIMVINNTDADTAYSNVPAIDDFKWYLVK